ncbi:hypothetical protein BH24ACI1_BH24ACI1_15450 [soil metagenome]
MAICGNATLSGRDDINHSGGWFYEKYSQQSAFFAFFIFCLSICFSSGKFKAAENSSSKQSDVAKLYQTNCAKCHGKDGQAKSFRGKLLKAQNLTDSTWQADVSDEHIFNVISNGHKKMPAFGKKLSEEEINSLVAYVRKLKK